MEETKKCLKCGDVKVINKFRIRKNKDRLYVDSTCMACKGTMWRAQIGLRLLLEFDCKCACCGEDHPQFLTLEHIQGGGSKEYGIFRNVFSVRATKNRQQVIRKAEKDEWDRTKYELLCINCNWAKGQFGQCPHRTGVTKEQVIESLREKSKGIEPGRPNPIRANQEAGWFKKGFDSRRVNKVLEAVEKESLRTN